MLNFLGKCIVFHGIKAEYPDADDEAAHDAHEVGIEHEQRGHGGKGEDAGHDEVVGRGHAERGESVDFLIDLHGPDDGGIGAPVRPARMMPVMIAPMMRVMLTATSWKRRFPRRTS